MSGSDSVSGSRSSSSSSSSSRSSRGDHGDGEGWLDELDGSSSSPSNSTEETDSEDSPDGVEKDTPTKNADDAGGTDGATDETTSNSDKDDGDAFYGIGTKDNGLPWKRGKAPETPPDGKIILDFPGENNRYIEVDENQQINKELFQEILKKLGYDETQIEGFARKFETESLDTGGKMGIAEAFDEVLGIDDTDDTVIDGSSADKADASSTFPSHSFDRLQDLSTADPAGVRQGVFGDLPSDVLEVIDDTKEDMRQALREGDSPVQIAKEAFAELRAELDSHGQSDNPVALMAMTDGLMQMMSELGPPAAGDILHGIREGLTGGLGEDGTDPGSMDHKKVFMAALVLNGPEMAAFWDDGHSDVGESLASRDYSKMNEYFKDGGDNYKDFWKYDHDGGCPIGMMAGKASNANSNGNFDDMKKLAEKHGQRYWK